MDSANVNEVSFRGCAREEINFSIVIFFVNILISMIEFFFAQRMACNVE